MINNFKLYKLSNMHLKGYNPVNVGSHESDNDHSYGPAIRKYYLLHYVISGSVSFQKGDKHYEVGSGQCFIIRPDEITVYSASGHWHYVWIGFCAGEVPAFLKTLDIADAKDLEHIFLEIEANVDKYNAPSSKKGAREAYLSGKISEIMAMLELAYDKPAESDSELEIKKIKDYIDLRLSSDLKVGNIADTFNISAAHLSRKFKEIVGESPQNYIINARLKEAAGLMLVHGLSPTAASAAVGYSDIYLFSKMFKRRYGISPRKYKKEGSFVKNG